MAPPDRGYRLLRDAVLSLSLTQEFVRPLFHWRTSRPHDYHTSPLNALADDNAAFSAGPAHGMPLQNIRLGEDDYLFDHLANAFNLLYFTAQTIPDAILQAVQQLQAQGVPLQVLAIQTSSVAKVAHNLIDHDGHFAQRYDAAEGSAYLARPDQHVCARWKHLSADQLIAAIQQALGQGASA
jgi:3-(3-hydroxy-phenyl)propionate hydroxylase